MQTSKVTTPVLPPFNETRYIAEHNTIFRAKIGSTVHGLNIEGQDDMDEMGVCVEPPDVILGLKKFEQWVYRTKPNGVRSGPGDLDLTIYGLRKFCSLAAGGNPSIINLFFVPYEARISHTTLGNELQRAAPLFASKKILRAFIGYMDAQRNRLLGEQGQKRVNRPELIEKYGFDTKYAMHALRLGYQGLEYARTQRISFPMRDDLKAMLRDTREGRKSLDFVKATFSVIRTELDEELKNSTLPDVPDYAGINKLMINFYLRHWQHNMTIRQAMKGWASH